MPVETIHTMQCNEVDELFDELHREEVTATVEVHTTIGKARLVLYHHSGQAHSLWLLADQWQ